MDKIKFGVYSIMNKKILTLGLVLALALTFNCKKDSDDDDMPLLALLYIADQTSGNCAQVTKGTPYTVHLSVVPKGGCKVDQTRAAALETAKSQYEKLIAVFTKAGSACDSTTATWTKMRDELTVDKISPTEEQYKTNVDKSRAVSVGSLIDEAKNTLAAGGYDLTKVKLGTLDQYFVNAAASVAYSNVGCQTAVKALDEALFTGIDAKTIVLNSACSYGTGATDATRCATLNDEF